MSWQPISEEEIWDRIIDARSRMSLEQRRLRDTIQIVPEKWRLHPWGDEGQGFWSVAVIGKKVVWYNDIEHGFNLSTYIQPGEIGEYWCNQDELELTVQFLVDEIRDGHSTASFCGPPIPLDEAD